MQDESQNKIQSEKLRESNGTSVPLNEDQKMEQSKHFTIPVPI